MAVIVSAALACTAAHVEDILTGSFNMLLFMLLFGGCNLWYYVLDGSSVRLRHLLHNALAVAEAGWHRKI